MPRPEASWSRDFAGLESLEPAAATLLNQDAQHISVPAGTRLFGIGDPCRDFVLVAGGSVRVQMVGESGREVVLYRVGHGQTCILTTSCLLGRSDYPAEGIAETPVEAFVVPGPLFSRLVSESPAFRRFVFGAFGSRLADLMAVIEAVAFDRIEARLARWLLHRAAGADSVTATHQAIATEIGTAREVVSRHLSALARRGAVGLERGMVRLVDRRALEAMAGRPVV